MALTEHVVPSTAQLRRLPATYAGYLMGRCEAVPQSAQRLHHTLDGQLLLGLPSAAHSLSTPSCAPLSRQLHRAPTSCTYDIFFMLRCCLGYTVQLSAWYQ